MLVDPELLAQVKNGCAIAVVTVMMQFMCGAESFWLLPVLSSSPFSDDV